MTPQEFADKQLTGFVVSKTEDLQCRFSQTPDQSQSQSLHNRINYYAEILTLLIGSSSKGKPPTFNRADWDDVVNNLIEFVQDKINDCLYWLKTNTPANPANGDCKAKLVIYQSWETQLSYLSHL